MAVRKKVIDRAYEILAERGPMPARTLLDVLHDDLGTIIPSSRELGRKLGEDQRFTALEDRKPTHSKGCLVWRVVNAPQQ